MLSSRCSQVSTVLFLLIALGFGVFMGQASSKLKAAKAANAKVGSLAGRQAVVFGGTAGIGQGLAERLAAGGADVTIVGRNEEAGAKIVSTMQEANPAGRYAFLKADLMLLRNCKQTVETLQKSVTRLDYIVLCQTKATTQGLTKTEEGVDEKLGLHYFTRVFLGELLAPLMEQTASTHNADVRVMSVLSAGVHAVYPHLATDPFLEEHYSLKNAADAAGVYNDLWIQQAAHDHPSITYVHAAPGFVASNWGTDLPTAMRCSVRVMQATPFAKSIGDCAELLVQGLISPERRGGFVLLNEFGDDAKPTDAQTQGNVDLLHQQTQRVLQPFF